MVISANAVQAGPAALSATILTAAMVSGAALPSATVIGTAKTATLLPGIQKTLIVAAFAAGVGTGVGWIHHQPFNARESERQALMKLAR